MGEDKGGDRGMERGSRAGRERKGVSRMWNHGKYESERERARASKREKSSVM
jgi:hypothetical protein